MSFPFGDGPVLGPYSCKPQVKEALPKFWETEFPDGGYERCSGEIYYKDDDSYYYGVEVEVECNYHNQTNLFQCALLEDNTFCILRIGPRPGISEDGLIPVASPYPTIYIPDEILGRKVSQIGRGCRKHELYTSSTTEGLKGLQELVLPETIEQINDEAFGGDILGSFTQTSFRVNIPNSVKKIGERIFIRDNFQSPQIDIFITPEQQSFTVMQDALFDKSNRRLISYVGAVVRDQVKKYDIPQGIHHIESFSFKNAGQFSQIHIPSSVKRIGEEAFCDCEIESIIFEEGVETIEKSAFQVYSDTLKKVILPKSVNEIGYKAFVYTPAATFTVPRDSYAASWAIKEDKKREYIDAMDWLKE